MKGSVAVVRAAFAERLNRLFEGVHPPGRGPFSSAEVVAGVRAHGVTMSAPYLSQLRTGHRRHPSDKTMAALAEFFGVQPKYFTDETTTIASVPSWRG